MSKMKFQQEYIACYLGGRGHKNDCSLELYLGNVTKEEKTSLQMYLF